MAKSTSLPEENPVILRATKNRSAKAPQGIDAKKALPRANYPHIFLPLHLLELAEQFWLKLSTRKGNTGQLRALCLLERKRVENKIL